MPESIAKLLKKIRESKNITLLEAAEKTRIPKNIIQAIEEDKLKNAFTSEFYAKSFVKTYAKFLGVVNDKAIKEYLESFPLQKNRDSYVLFKKEPPKAEWFIKNKKYFGYAILTVLIGYLLLWGGIHVVKFARNTSLKYTRYVEKLRQNRKAKVKPKTKPKTATKVQAPKDSASTSNKAIEELELELIANSNTWLQVISDGKLTFSGTLTKNKRDTWKAKEKIELELGNAGGVKVLLNKKDLGTLGKKGEKKKVIIDKHGII